MSNALAEEKKNQNENHLNERRAAHDESYTNKKEARQMMSTSMDMQFSETTEQYNARIAAELKEKEEAEAQLAELKAFEASCVAALNEHVEVKSSMMTML